MNTEILKHGKAFQLLTTPPKDERFNELVTALATLCHSGALVGSVDHGVNSVAIELPCGLPLYINFQHRTYSEREKGFLHFFTFTSIRNGLDKVLQAKEILQLDEPKRFTITTMTKKKLSAAIEYWDKVAVCALTLENDANTLLNEWRAKIANCPYTWRSYSHKENSNTAINGCIYSEKFEYALSLSASYPHPSESVKFKGDNTLNDFLALSDDTSEDKQWFNVDFTGLNYTHAGFLCYGTKYAVTLWCKRTEKSLKSIGFIMRMDSMQTDCKSTARFVTIVRLKELLS